MQEKKKRGVSWSSAIGWLIFILVVAGTPLLNMLRSALAGIVNLPANLMPMLIGGLVALSILVSVIRSLGGSRRSQSDTQLPTTTARQQAVKYRLARLDRKLGSGTCSIPF